MSEALRIADERTIEEIAAVRDERTIRNRRRTTMRRKLRTVGASRLAV